MSNASAWGYAALTGSSLLLVLSLTVFSGGAAIAAGIACVVLGILSGGLLSLGASRD